MALATNFGTKQEAAALLGITWHSLRNYRPLWIEGVHYIKVNDRRYRYNLDLIADWQVNQGDEISHSRTIDKYRASLGSRSG